jgi:SAM-dependent methyltransferase
MDSAELERWFENVRTSLETAYLAKSEPWSQSGMSGPEQRWTALRKPIADCIDRPGSFLDIGCANGYLLECCLRWTAERGFAIDPFGLDVSSGLLDLARRRLPHFSDHFYQGNGFYWQPSRRFDFVRTELVYVPGELERDLVVRLLERVVAPGGRLLVANYGEGSPHPETGLLPGCHPTRFLLERLAELRLAPIDSRSGYDPVKGRHVRVAILSAESVLD